MEIQHPISSRWSPGCEDWFMAEIHATTFNEKILSHRNDPFTSKRFPSRRKDSFHSHGRLTSARSAKIQNAFETHSKSYEDAYWRRLCFMRRWWWISSRCANL